MNGLTTPRSTSVIIAAYSLQRWDDMCAAIASAVQQSRPALEIVLVIDHNDILLEKARSAFPDIIVAPNTASKGASGARNTGVAISRGEIAAFLDDDAVASDAWLERLLPHFTDPRVIGVGGRLQPLWEQTRPRWFPPEFDWVIGASYRGMPQEATPVRNVWSGNMAIRRDVFAAVQGFREGFGKVGSRSRPEDTDLCLRATASCQGGAWIYEPASIAWHRVPAQRTTRRFFLSRCFHEGRGKADLATLDGARNSTSAERQYVRRVLLRRIAQGISELFHGDVHGGFQGIAIAAGLACTVVGYAIGRLAAVMRAGRPVAAVGAPDAKASVVPAVTILNDEPQGDAEHAYRY